MEENKNIKTRDELKKYFETGCHPTEAQFVEFIDSYAHLNEFLLLENAVKNAQEDYARLKDFPIVKVSQLSPRETPVWSNIVLYANKAALDAGLIAGDLFWMEAIELPETPLALMRVRDLEKMADRDNEINKSSASDDAGIGGGILEAWANGFQGTL